MKTIILLLTAFFTVNNINAENKNKIEMNSIKLLEKDIKKYITIIERIGDEIASQNNGKANCDMLSNEFYMARKNVNIYEKKLKEIYPNSIIYACNLTVAINDIGFKLASEKNMDLKKKKEFEKELLELHGEKYMQLNKYLLNLKDLQKLIQLITISHQKSEKLDDVKIYTKKLKEKYHSSIISVCNLTVAINDIEFKLVSKKNMNFKKKKEFEKELLKLCENKKIQLNQYLLSLDDIQKLIKLKTISNQKSEKVYEFKENIRILIKKTPEGKKAFKEYNRLLKEKNGIRLKKMLQEKVPCTLQKRFHQKGQKGSMHPTK